MALSEKVLPYGIPDDLPNYEDSERHDAEKALDHLQDKMWNFEDLNINVTVVDASGDGLTSQNFETRWDFLRFLQDQLDQVTANRIELETRVAALRWEVDEAKRQNAEEKELNELLHLHVDAERAMAQNMLVGDIEEEQRRTGCQIKGNERRRPEAEWWHSGLGPVPGEDETVI
ncbi:MAG: hypothetical protein Q9169_002153 [Polycauliona sp. 2 TL-2023]